MKNQPAINYRYTYLLILVIAAIALSVAVNDLFFFDEDVFVIGGNGVFLQNLWQRSVIVKLTFIADNFIWAKNPVGYHYTNLILHLANAILALSVLKQLLKLISNYVSKFQQIATQYIFFILFLISPVHSEPLCYILARGGSVVAFFSLLSVLFFFKSNYTNKLLLFFSVVSFLFALFSYEVSWMVPFVILSIVVFSNYIKGESIVKKAWVAIPYFLVFAIWFIVKVVVIDKMVVSDYKDEDLFSIGFATMVKNSSVLFLRNFIPPFKNAIIFLSVSIVFIVTLFIGLFLLYKKHRQIFYFSVLLIILTVFGYAATVVFGIDSHDSESERYVYFSSVFALMLLSVLIAALIRNKVAFFAVLLTLCCCYCASLFTTINSYRAAGNFSKMYLQQIDKKINTNSSVFFVNMPSQHNGALLFRAKSRIGGNTNDSISVMQEYLSYLYNKSNVCITLSSKELCKVPERLTVLEKPVDSIFTFFPEIKFNKQDLRITAEKSNSFSFEKNNSIVVALQDSVLYFFK
ncbi:hypothetical protein [Ferruginibacter sp.]|nr:hypothetical protein [Ferruginibacter sp.]